MSGQDGNDNKTILGKTLTFPQKVALVKPSGGGVTVASGVSSDGKTTTVSAVGQPQQQQGGPTTYRTINQPHMRLVMPASGSVPTPQIIQTHLMPQAMLKSVDPSGRTQITALPARSLAQTSITVTRSPTPTSFVPRATNVAGARATVVTNPRTPTPPTANITNFVRNSGSTSRTPSPAAATVISAVPGTTWMSTVPAGVQVGVQGTHLIRASINPSGRPQGRVLTQQNTGTGVVSSVASSSVTNVTSSVQVSQSGIVQSPQVSQMQQSGAGGQILATVQCPRPQTATLVYSNVSNHGQGPAFGTTGAGGAQRLTLSHTRPIRPIQLTATNNRITGTGLRTANISIRPPNVPGLTSTNVLTTNLSGQGQSVGQQNQGTGLNQQQQRTGPGGLVTGGIGGGGVVGGTNTGTGSLATRIIQVQAPQSGGTTQVINTGRIAGNLMTLTPVLSQGAGGGGGIVGRGGAGGGTGGGAGKVQPSLTITHLGKPPQQQQQGQQMGGPNVGGGGNAGHIVVSHSQAPQQQTMIVTMGGNQSVLGGGGPLTTTAATIVGPQGHHQMMNVVSSSSGGGVSVSNASVSGTTTMLPLSGITTTVGRGGATGIVRTLTSQGNLGPGSGGGGTTATLLPLGKVLPQGGGGQGGTTGPTVVETQLQQAKQAGSIFIHSRSPNPVQVSGGQGGTSGAGNSGILTLAAATANTSLSNLISAVPYSVQSTTTGGGTGGGMGGGGSAGSSFAVVTNRGGTSLQGVIPMATSQIMTSTGQGNNSVTVSTGGGQQPTHQIITMTQSQQQQQGSGGGGQHIMIPVPGTAAGKLSGTTIGQSPRPGILRKRDNEGIVITAASGASIAVSSTVNSGVMNVTTVSMAGGGGGSMGTLAHSTQQQVVKGVKNLVPILHAIGSGGNAATGSGGLNVISAPSAKMEIIAKERTGLYVSPPAGSPSDGSTTVSATSSPGVDKQQQQQQNQQQENELNSVSLSLKLQSELKKCRNKEKEAAAAAAAAGGSGNARSREPSPRKKIKRQNDSGADFVDGGGGGGVGSGAGAVTAPKTPGNKENSHPTTNAATSGIIGGGVGSQIAEVEVKKPRTCSLLEAYRQNVNWKAAHNHFQRYSDVKPREERRPTVIDLANQANVTQKVNGWKIHHLCSQMDDLCEMESQVYDKLAEMLQCMEAHDQSAEVDRVNELLKGNMQRSKIVNEGITESKRQIKRVFDHKTHISDIIHRCASKRNFKKREKV